MSGNIKTREFAISDYDTALELWQRVRGLEIAEGDEREGRFPLSRAQPEPEQSGYRWRSDCWRRIVRSRRTPRIYLSSGG